MSRKNSRSRKPSKHVSQGVNGSSWQVYTRPDTDSRFKPHCIVEADTMDDAMSLARASVMGSDAIVKVVRITEMRCHHRNKDTGNPCAYAWKYKGLRQNATCPNCYKQVKVSI